MKKISALLVLIILSMFAWQTPAKATVAAVLYSDVVTLTDAQIRVLPTSSGFEIVPAPGADKMILPTSIVVNFKWEGSYTNIAGTATLAVVHDGYGLVTSVSEAWNNGVSNLLANDANAITFLNPLSDISNLPDMKAGYNSPEYFSNQGLKLILYNQFNGNLTGGDPNNTLTITVFYVVVDL